MSVKVSIKRFWMCDMYKKLWHFIDQGQIILLISASHSYSTLKPSQNTTNKLWLK